MGYILSYREGNGGSPKDYGGFCESWVVDSVNLENKMDYFQDNIQDSGNLFVEEYFYANVNNIVDSNLKIYRTYDLDMYDLKYQYYAE